MLDLIAVHNFKQMLNWNTENANKSDKTLFLSTPKGHDVFYRNIKLFLAFETGALYEKEYKGVLNG